MANTAPSAFCPLLMRIALNRNRATRVAAWIAVIFLAALSAAHAQESRYALIIGVSEYSDPNVSALTGGASDIRTARSIASSMGIPEANMRVLRDKDATKQNVIAELQALSRRVPAGGRAFIYFSGHGTRWHDPTLNACAEGLMTYDTKTVSSDEIAQYTRRISEVADKTIVLFDACFSGGVNQMDHVRTRSLSGAQLVP
ncbi:MAG: caspase family protein, partial [Burkholderiaceae bacterium]